MTHVHFLLIFFFLVSVIQSLLLVRNSKFKEKTLKTIVFDSFSFIGGLA